FGGTTFARQRLRSHRPPIRSGGGRPRGRALVVGEPRCAPKRYLQSARCGWPVLHVPPLRHDGRADHPPAALRRIARILPIPRGHLLPPPNRTDGRGPPPPTPREFHLPLAPS